MVATLRSSTTAVASSSLAVRPASSTDRFTTFTIPRIPASPTPTIALKLDTSEEDTDTSSELEDPTSSEPEDPTSSVLTTSETVLPSTKISKPSLTPNGNKAGIAGGDAYSFFQDHIGWWYDWYDISVVAAQI
ncbi:hypothetical protein H0H87_012458 [Tephrocybe sp. NHM501043]|nr:hypothetical protein H0H87_012458 [Tephrocybe sp. NHM501043]